MPRVENIYYTVGGGGSCPPIMTNKSNFSTKNWIRVGKFETVVSFWGNYCLELENQKQFFSILGPFNVANFGVRTVGIVDF